MIEYADSLTVHLLNSEPVVIRQLVIRAQSLIPGIHERSRNRAVCQAKRVAKFMRGHREKAGPWKAKEKHFSRQAWLFLSLTHSRLFLLPSTSISSSLVPNFSSSFTSFLREKRRVAHCWETKRRSRRNSSSYHERFFLSCGGRWRNVDQRTKGAIRSANFLVTNLRRDTYLHTLESRAVNSSWLRYTGSQVLLIKSLLEDEHENKWNGLRSSSEGTRDSRDSRYIFNDILFVI